MKDDKILLQLLQQTSSDDDTLHADDEFASPVLFVDLGKLVVTDSIDVVVPELVVVLPRVSEEYFVPAPEEIQ